MREIFPQIYSILPYKFKFLSKITPSYLYELHASNGESLIRMDSGLVLRLFVTIMYLDLSIFGVSLLHVNHS